MHQKSMLTAGVKVSPLLPSHGQAKEPSDTNHRRSKQQTVVPPRAMHHAHSCYHFGFGLASWLFLRVRKKSWSPTLSFCPKPIPALQTQRRLQTANKSPRQRLSTRCQWHSSGQSSRADSWDSHHVKLHSLEQWAADEAAEGHRTMVAPSISAASRAPCGKLQHHTLNCSIHDHWVQNSLVVANRLKVGGETTFLLMTFYIVGREGGQQKELGYMPFIIPE